MVHTHGCIERYDKMERLFPVLKLLIYCRCRSELQSGINIWIEDEDNNIKLIT